MDEVEILEPDPAWTQRFREEEAALRQILCMFDVQTIEHFGSTSVPNLPAKPIIDILVIVPSLDCVRSALVLRLESVGYAYWAANPMVDRLFFVKGLPPRAPRRTHHIFVAERPSEMWDRLLFRDYLRAKPHECLRYAELKRDLARRFADDREAYTHGKSKYIRAIMKDARKWRETIRLI